MSVTGYEPEKIFISSKTGDAIFFWNTELKHFEDSRTDQKQKLAMIMFVLKTVIVLQLALWSCAFKIEPRILNGETAGPREFPYFAHVLEGTGICGGALINER